MPVVIYDEHEVLSFLCAISEAVLLACGIGNFSAVEAVYLMLLVVITEVYEQSYANGCMSYLFFTVMIWLACCLSQQLQLSV